MLCIVPADLGDLVLLVLHMLKVFKDPCVPGRQVELVQIFLHDLTGTAVQRPDMYVMGVGRRDSNKETASVAVQYHHNFRYMGRGSGGARAIRMFGLRTISRRNKENVQIKGANHAVDVYHHLIVKIIAI